MTQDTEEPPSEGEAVRHLIKRLSANGVSYRRLAESVDPQWGWTEAAIKQLVTRGGTLRPNSKNAALVRTVRKLSRQLVAETPQHQIEELLDLIDVAGSFGGVEMKSTREDINSMTRFIGRRFQKIRRTSAEFEWPARSAFVRWDWQRRRLVTILVDTRVGDDGVVFAMKISGNESRRIVVGDVLTTARNTYFSGLAYEISAELDDEAFSRINAFDIDELRENTGPNEIGLECFTVSNNYLHQRTTTVTFQGLDGRGNPISGLGELIKAPAFTAFNIGENGWSVAECSKSNAQLTAKLREAGDITVGPTTIGDFDEASVVGDFAPAEDGVSHEGWAYLRPREDGRVDILFSQAKHVSHGPAAPRR